MNKYTTEQFSNLLQRTGGMVTELIAELPTEQERKLAEIVGEIYRHELENFLGMFGKEG